MTKSFSKILFIVIISQLYKVVNHKDNSPNRKFSDQNPSIFSSNFDEIEVCNLIYYN